MRLTYRDRTVPHTNKKGELWEAYSDANYNEVINRLAAYEDTEFEPEEIDFCLGGAISPQEAMERYEAHKKRYDEWFAWKQAEEQGRLVILPCNVGDKVYLLWSCGKYGKSVSEMVVKHIDIDLMPDIEFACRKEKGSGSYWFFKLKDIGKTVFLSREEAEAALKNSTEKEK